MLSPVIACRNCCSLSLSWYRVVKKSSPTFNSFCGWPVRRASVSDPQKG